MARWIKCGSHGDKNEQGDVVPVRGGGSQPRLVRGRNADARWRLTTEACTRGLVVWPQNHQVDGFMVWASKPWARTRPCLDRWPRRVEELRSGGQAA